MHHNGPKTQKIILEHMQILFLLEKNILQLKELSRKLQSCRSFSYKALQTVKCLGYTVCTHEDNPDLPARLNQ